MRRGRRSARHERGGGGGEAPGGVRELSAQALTTLHTRAAPLLWLSVGTPAIVPPRDLVPGQPQWWRPTGMTVGVWETGSSITRATRP